MQVRRGELVDVLEGDGLVAERLGGRGSGQPSGVAADRAQLVGTGEPVGLVSWVVDARGADAEIRVLAVDDSARGGGIGRALLEAAEAALRALGVRRAWLVTTNDNLAALALYQKAGWRLSELRPGALEEARRTLKPQIGEIGEHGIPLRDELELEKLL